MQGKSPKPLPSVEPRIPGPTQRALEALAEASSRARSAAPIGDRAPAPATSSSHRIEFKIKAAIVVVTALVVGLACFVVAEAVVGSTAPGGPPFASAPASAPTSSVAVPRASRSSQPTQVGGAPAALAPPVSTTTTAPVEVVPGGPPRIASMLPSTGSAGDQLVLSGTNFFSPDGSIQAWFGAVQAVTRCPDETTCTVIVPQISGIPPGAWVPVTLSTEAGVSNALSFTYS